MLRRALVTFFLLSPACSRQAAQSPPASGAATASVSAKAPTSLPLRVSLSSIPATAPRRLLVGPQGPEVLWANADARGVHVVRTQLLGNAQKDTELLVLTPPARVLRFDAARDDSGTYHIGLLLHANDQVKTLVARWDGALPFVKELASVPSVGGFDTHGDGTIEYPKVDDYESLQVMPSAAGDTFLAWTDGSSTNIHRVDRAGRVSLSGPLGGGRKASLALDARGGVHVLSVGQDDCSGGGPLCNDDVVYARWTHGAWKTERLFHASGASPELVVHRGAVATALLLGRKVQMVGIDSASGTLLEPGPESTFTWSTAMSQSGEPWVLGVSRSGTVHAMSLAKKLEPSRGPLDVPLFDLRSFEPEGGDGQAVSVLGDTYILVPVHSGLELRRVAQPGSAQRMPRLTFVDTKRGQLRLGDAETSAHVSELPHSGAYADIDAVIADGCIVPLGTSVPIAFGSVLFASRAFLRVASPLKNSWRLEEYRLAPLTVSKPFGDVHVAPGQVRRETVTTECENRTVAIGKPTLARTEQISLPADAVWVGSDSTGAFALVKEVNGATLKRFEWSMPKASVDVVARVEAAAEPSSFVVRRDAAGVVYAAYSLRESNAVVILRNGREEARLSADQGAFAFLLEPGNGISWVVRRSETLIYERQGASGIEREELGVTDALPLAAIRAPSGGLMVALANPYGAALVTSFSKNSTWTGRLGPPCFSGKLSGAAFRTPSVLALACE